MNPNNYEAIIIGAGAAGLMCAIEAGKRGRSVLLLDHAKSVGEKIRISGGGRCNFTNLYASPNNYLSKNPKFCMSALARFAQQDFISLLKKHKIKFHEKKLGQLFCDNSSQDIINMLLKECQDAGVTIKTNTCITKISRTSSEFVINTNNKNYICESLVIATGGKSIPKMGATGFGYDIAQQFGLNIIETQAGLVPFVLSEADLKKLKNLAGVAVNVVVSYNDHKFDEAMLFTHRGISGPAILQISSYWRPGDSIKINLTPEHNVNKLLQHKKKTNPTATLNSVLSDILPKRLAMLIFNELNITCNLADLSNKQIDVITKRINAWEVIPIGTEGYRTAEVTLGGVDTKCISSKTFEANSVKGLYFIGEVLDVTGHLGGFNFQWAWSSGYAAGQFV